MIIIPYKYNL